MPTKPPYEFGPLREEEKGVRNVRSLFRSSSGLTANITGNLSGSVGSVTGNVGGNVAGNVTGSIGSISGVTFPANFSGLTITSGRVNADITHWLGQDVPTPTVAGVSEVDITHVSGTPVCH